MTINHTEGVTMTIASMHRLIRHSIDEARTIASPSPPSMGEIVHTTICALYARIPRHHRLMTLKDMVEWEEQFGKEYPEGII